MSAKGTSRRSGYVMLRQAHHRASQRGYVLEHILIAERALRRPFPAGAEVHHVNGVRDDNRSCNLVVCEDRAFHMLLHARARALKASGHPDWRPCWLCGSYDAPAALHREGRGHVHPACRVAYKARRAANP